MSGEPSNEDCAREWTIYTVAGHWQALNPTVTTGVDLLLDLSEVSEFDTAGLQLLLMARREAERHGGQLGVREMSPAVGAAVRLARLENHPLFETVINGVQS